MKQTSTERVTQYRESQLKLGRRKRECYLTDEEWVVIKDAIKLIRDKEKSDD